MKNKFQMVAKTFQGLEEVLRDELISLGAENVEAGKRMVQFEGDLAMMYKANLCCRTALRILKPIIKFTASDTDGLYDAVREIDWENYMTPDSTFSVDSTVSGVDFTHSKFVTYRVKDGIADHFNDICGRRPSVRLQGADVELDVHISDDRVTISLNSSGESLSKRGYKVENTKAPINEVLAAGLIMKTGWRGECDFADPMCGSGTFLIEAALIAANINPGIYREKFAFEKWPDFDKELFEDIYNDDSAERDFAYRILGGDVDPEAVRTARRNVKSAKVENMVEITCRDIEEWTDNDPEGVMVTNPPYGQRLQPFDMAASAFYKKIGSCLKNNFQGWHVWVIALAEGPITDLGLKPSVKIPVLNGGLECTFNEYVLFNGKYNDFRADGGMVKHGSQKEESPKIRRMTDHEWEEEARGFDGKSRKKDLGRKKDFGGKDSGRRDFDRKNDFGGKDSGRRDFDRKKDFGGKESEHRNFGKKDFGGKRDFDRKRDDRRPGGDREFDRKNAGKRFEHRDDRTQPRKIVDKGPSLTHYEETRAPGLMRSRRTLKDSFGKNGED